MSETGKLRRHAKEVDNKAELRRFKNREAARRVRERKSNQLNTLQGQVDELRKENQKLLLVIQQLQTTTLTGTTSNAGVLNFLPAAAPTSSIPPTDSMESNPSAAPGASPINSGIRSGPTADTLPRFSTSVLEPDDSSPLNDPCIMSQPGNAIVSGALLSGSTLLPGTMSAPVLVQHSSLCLRPDEVPLQRTCGCSGDEECEECEGVQVTMCSSSTLPLITTPGPKPKPLTLDDLNLPVPVLEDVEYSQGTSGAVAAAGTSSKAVSSGRWQQQLLSQNSFGTKERAAVLQPPHHSAAAVLGRSKSDVASQKQQHVLSGQNAQNAAHKRQHARHRNEHLQQSVAHKQAVGDMDLDLVETLEPTRPRAGARFIDIGSSSGNVVAPATAAVDSCKNYAGVCYVRKGSDDAAAAVQQLNRQPCEEQQQGRQKLLRMESAVDTGGGASAAIVADLDFADVLQGEMTNSAERHALHDSTGVADLMGSTASGNQTDPAAAPAANAGVRQTGGSGTDLCRVVLADVVQDSSGLDAEDLATLIAPCHTSGLTGLQASAAMAMEMPSPAGDMVATEFIPMLPSAVVTGASELCVDGDGSSARHSKGPKFLRNLAAAVGSFVKHPGSRSAASTPRAATQVDSAPFTACAPAASLTGGATSSSGGGMSGAVRSIRSASETGVVQRDGLVISSADAILYGTGSGIGAAAHQVAQQHQQLTLEMQQLQRGSVPGAMGMLSGPHSYMAALPSPNAALPSQQQQEGMLLLQQQRQQRQLLMPQLQQQQHAASLSVSQHNAASGHSLPNLNQLCNGSPSMSPQMWSSLSVIDARSERFCSFSNGHGASVAAAAAANANSWPCNPNTSAAWQPRPTSQVGAGQRGRCFTAAAAAGGSGGFEGLAPVLDDGSEEDAVMQLALQEGILLSGL